MLPQERDAHSAQCHFFHVFVFTWYAVLALCAHSNDNPKNCVISIVKASFALRWIVIARINSVCLLLAYALRSRCRRNAVALLSASYQRLLGNIHSQVIYAVWTDSPGPALLSHIFDEFYFLLILWAHCSFWRIPSLPSSSSLRNAMWWHFAKVKIVSLAGKTMLWFIAWDFHWHSNLFAYDERHFNVVCYGACTRVAAQNFVIFNLLSTLERMHMSVWAERLRWTGSAQMANPYKHLDCYYCYFIASLQIWTLPHLHADKYACGIPMRE